MVDSVSPATVGAVALAGTALLATVDPSTSGIPLCPLHALTGLDCPFCGSLRAVHALTRLDIVAALDHNVVFTLAVPLLVLGWLRWMWRATRPASGVVDAPIGPGVPRWLGTGAVVFLVVFASARNLAPLAWLASEAG